MTGTTVDRTFTRPTGNRFYDNMAVVEKLNEDFDFAAGALSFTIGRPNGARFAKILSVNIFNVTEVFNSDTTAARVDIGTVADANRYLNFEIPNVAVGGEADLNDDKDAISGTTYGDGLIDLDSESITQLEVDFVSNTGGTPTGIASVRIEVGFF